MKKHFFLFFSVFMIFLNAQSFSIDPSFGNGGYCMYSNFYTTSDAVMLPDGQFITATSTGSITIKKVNQSGIIDTSFGTKNYDMGTSTIDKSESIKKIVLHNDKIMIYGRVNATPTHSLNDLFLTRINLDGTLDTSFGTNGFTTQSVGQNGTAEDIAMDSNGNSYLHAYNLGNYIIKVTPNGVIDNTFGTNGKLMLNSFTLKKIYVQNDGKLIFAGSKTNTVTNIQESYIERRLPDGTYDSTFGSNGTVIIPSSIPSTILNFEYDYSNNSILILNHGTGSSAATIFLSKIQISNGALVSGFGTNGITPNYYFTDAPQIYLNQIISLSNSKIVIMGIITNLFGTSQMINQQLFVARFNSNGSIDYSTSNKGYQIFNTTPPNTGMRADYVRKLFNLNNGSLVLCYAGGSVTHGDKSFLCKFNNAYLGTNEIPAKDLNNTFVLYPNPAGDHVTIQNKKYNYESFIYRIVDMSGKVLQNGSSKFNTPMDIQRLEKGNYMIQLETQKGDKQTMKLIKK